ncbi:MAG: hypothetical protein C0410_03645 [Anaerolinea sp.]|nr:hypothetical protein [Anaerolinea sp.]
MMVGSPPNPPISYFVFEGIMPIISSVCIIDQPLRSISQERLEYSSPNMLWRADFYDRYEWHMCAPGWQLSVISSISGIKLVTHELDELSKDKGFLCSEDYSPWSADSKILALSSWDSGLILFNPLQNTCQIREQLPWIIQWSPTVNHLLIFSNDKFSILDGVGNNLSLIDWQTTEHTLPHVGWLISGKMFFIIGRSSKRSKPRITFFRAEDGTMVSNELIDPIKCVPYDDNKYKNISRSGYSLVLSRSTRTIGSYLDTWHDMFYDQEKGTIALSIYRPVSEIFDLNGYPVCEVEKKWISIKLNG